MIRPIVIAAVLFLSVPADAGTTHFEDLVTEAFANLAAAGAVRGHAEAQADHADAEAAWDDPRVSLSASNVPWREFSLAEHPMSGVELKATQSIPYPGKREARAELVRRQADVTRSMAAPLEVQLGRMAVGPYFEAVEIERQFPVLEAKVGLLDELVRVAEARYGAGGGSASEAMYARVEWAALTRRLRVLRAMRERAEARFNAVLQRSPETVVGATVDPGAGALPVRTIEQWMAVAEENRPEFETLQARARAHHQAIEVEAFRDTPDFHFGGGWRFRTHDGDLGGRDFFTVLVGVDIPVWSHAVSRNESAAHRAHIVVIEEERLALARDIRGRLSVLVSEIALVDAEITAIAQVERPILDETLAVLRAEYPTGRSDFSALLRTELRALELDLRDVRLQTRRARVHQEIRIEVQAE